MYVYIYMFAIRNATYYKSHYSEFIAVFISLYERMKKLSYILSCIKQNVYTFLFYFLCLSCSCFSHSLRHTSLRLSTSSLTLQ